MGSIEFNLGSLRSFNINEDLYGQASHFLRRRGDASVKAESTSKKAGLNNLDNRM